MWDLILSVPDRCLSFYFGNQTLLKKSVISFVRRSYIKLLICKILSNSVQKCGR